MLGAFLFSDLATAWIFGLRCDARSAPHYPPPLAFVRSFCRLAVALIVVGGCSTDRQSHPVAGSRGGAATLGAAPASVGTTKGACPTNGQWSDCAVFDRLDHAGLAPRRDS